MLRAGRPYADERGDLMTNLSNTSNQQKPSPMPYGRYKAFEPVTVPDRTWPSQKITRAASTRACSVK